MATNEDRDGKLKRKQYEKEMNRLQAEGLLKREAPLRGRVGQPTIPMSIDPELSGL